VEPVDPPRPKRPLKMWIILLAAWAVGLCVWLFYLIVFAMLVFRLT
jgi:hypothetical protein